MAVEVKPVFYRERYELRAVFYLHLPEDTTKVGLDGLLAQKEPGRDFPVFVPLGDKLHDLGFLVAESFRVRGRFAGLDPVKDDLQPFVVYPYLPVMNDRYGFFELPHTLRR